MAKSENHALSKKDILFLCAVIAFAAALAGGWFTLQAEVNYNSLRQEELRVGVEECRKEDKIERDDVRKQLIAIQIQLARIETDLAYIRAHLDQRIEGSDYALRTERHTVEIERERDPPQVHSAVQPHLQ